MKILGIFITTQFLVPRNQIQGCFFEKFQAVMKHELLQKFITSELRDILERDLNQNVTMGHGYFYDFLGIFITVQF